MPTVATETGNPGGQITKTSSDMTMTYEMSQDKLTMKLRCVGITFRNG